MFFTRIHMSGYFHYLIICCVPLHCTEGIFFDYIFTIHTGHSPSPK